MGMRRENVSTLRWWVEVEVEAVKVSDGIKRVRESVWTQIHRRSEVGKKVTNVQLNAFVLNRP